MSAREPRARAWPAAVGVEESLFIWGGYGYPTNIQPTTLEKFNVCSLTWEHPRQLNGFLPSGLNNSAITGNGDFYSCGGDTASGRINTLYKINPCTLLCKELLPNSPSHAPQKQEGSRSVYFNSKIVIYGGYTGLGRIGDLHVFDLEKGEYVSLQYNIKS